MAEAIVFRQIGGQVYAAGPWPAQARFDVDALRVAPTFAVSPGGQVAIRVANGSAVYRLASGAGYQREVTMEFVAGNWTPPPGGVG